jgi:hypothetical protein
MQFAAHLAEQRHGFGPAAGNRRCTEHPRDHGALFEVSILRASRHRGIGIGEIGFEEARHLG